MNGVARTEHPPLGVAVGDHMVDLPLAGGENFDRDVCVADDPACAFNDGGFTQVRLSLSGVVHVEHHPFGPGFHTDESAAAHPIVVTRLDHPVKNAGAALTVAAQVGTQPDVDGATQARFAFQRDSEQFHHSATCTVGTDHVLGTNLILVAHGAIENARGDTIGILGEVEQFAVEAHLATGS
ncbi:hypothetical protein D3C78_1117680 [compost metagenome]